MANDCLAQIQACAMRVARLEPNGVPDPGANNLYVSDSLIKFEYTPVYSTGDEFEVKNACGDVCVNFKDQDRLKRADATLEICTPDPELSELLSGGVVLTAGAAVGYGAPTVGATPNPNGVSIELWTKRIDDDGNLDDVYPYAWWVFPRMYLRPAARTFENNPVNNLFEGYGLENPNWYNGPTNNWPLPNGSSRIFQWIPTTYIPTAMCGYQTISAS